MRQRVCADLGVTPVTVAACRLAVPMVPKAFVANIRQSYWPWSPLMRDRVEVSAEELGGSPMSGAGPDSAVWWKSSASNSAGCVEIAREGSLTLVRDSKDPSGPRLTFTPREWDAFLTGVRAGEFDLPEA